MDNNPKEIARKLRRAGHSLDYIYKKVKAPRSTVYYWISKTPLTKQQLSDLEAKRQAARKKGGQTRHLQRLRTIQKYQQSALQDIGNITDRELFLIGIALYWGEGAKQKGKNVSSGAEFCNQDPRMILLFSKWLDVISVPKDLRQYTLYIHEKHSSLECQIKLAWENNLKDYSISWQKTIFKRHQTQLKLKNDYIGLLRVRVRKSADLCRKISGWIYAVSSLTKV